MQLSPHCYAVTGLGYLRPRTVNAGFVVGTEVTLILDTGPNAQAAQTILGYARAARPQNDLMAMNLEPHFDHIGGNCVMSDAGLRIYGHESIQRTGTEFDLDYAGFGEDAAAFFHGTHLENPNYAVREDMMLDLGRCPVEVLVAPGHTQANLCVYVPADGVLFSGDTLVNGYPLNTSSGLFAQWLASLDRIERLAPKVVVPGHGPVAKGNEVPELFERVRAALRSTAAE